MKVASLAPLLLAAPAALGSVLPILDDLVDLGEDVLLAVDGLLNPQEDDIPELSITTGFSDHHGSLAGICTLRAKGGDADDSDNIMNTFKRCGKNSVVFMNSPQYNVNKAMKIRLENTVVQWSGWLKFSDDIDYWIKNSFDFEFQKQKLAFIIEGKNFVINGGNTGGIDGNGQVWYDYAKGFGNKPGRPMSLAIRNAENVAINDFSIIQPQFWAHIVIDSKDVVYSNCYVNATSTSGSFEEKSWLQNTDGIDTYRSRNVAIHNFVYQGGDDCIAFKPNSTNIAVHNATCVGGTGIAFGSIAQYDGVTDIIENVALNDIKLYPSNQVAGYQGIYFKSWIGESVGKQPNGGGGGTGWCKNVSVNNVYMEDIQRPIALTAGLTYLDDEHGKHKYGTFEWSRINFTNVRATSTANRAIWLDCSPAQPCTKFRFENVTITPGKDDHPKIHQVCNHVNDSVGLDDCHPNNSKRETDTGGTM